MPLTGPTPNLQLLDVRRHHIHVLDLLSLRQGEYRVDGRFM